MNADGSGQITITEFERPAKRLGPNRLIDDITFCQLHLSNMYCMEDKNHKSKHLQQVAFAVLPTS